MRIVMCYSKCGNAIGESLWVNSDMVDIDNQELPMFCVNCVRVVRMSSCVVSV